MFLFSCAAGRMRRPGGRNKEEMKMKIAVVCANGKAGRLIVKEAMGRGLDVTAVVRGENHSGAPKAICKDLFDLEAADLAGFDVVIDAFGAWTDETYPLHSSTLKHLCDILSRTETRLLVVGGAGSILGTVFGSAFIGVGETTFEFFTNASVGKVLIFACIILLLQFKPKGIFAVRNRALED